MKQKNAVEHLAFYLERVSVHLYVNNAVGCFRPIQYWTTKCCRASLRYGHLEKKEAKYFSRRTSKQINLNYRF